MARTIGDKLMFDEDDIRHTPDPALPRLIRQIFFVLNITNNGYLQRYHHYFRESNQGDKTQKEHSQKAAADRKFLLDPRKLTFNMARSVLTAMGYDIQAVSFTLRNRMTGDVITCSTDDSIEKLLEQRAASQEVGVSGFD